MPAAEAFLNDIKGWFPNSTVSTLSFCQNCDTDLVVVSGTDVIAFLSGETTKGSPPRPGGGLSGEDSNSFYCVNFPMEFKDNIYDSVKPERRDSAIDITRPGPSTGDTVVVAVFDSGVDPDVVRNQLYTNPDTSCMGPFSNNGWNFPAVSNDWLDDIPRKHGTVVAKMIVDQMYKGGNTYIKILPVKVHSSAGVSHLSDILCALMYARNRGANLINASFGFYAPVIAASSDTVSAGALLFKAFLQEYFKDNNMLMIAAAGNIDPVNEPFVYNSPDPDALRNLDSVSFFPASFAQSIPNIFAVTTVSESTGSQSPHQNFSRRVVDVGVNADAVSGTNYVFIHPYHIDSTVQGSSFAAPVVTGKMAAHYRDIQDLLSSGTVVNKEDILDRLATKGLLHPGGPSLQQKIKNGKIMNK